MGAVSPEGVGADDRSPTSEQERVHEDEWHSLMRSISIALEDDRHSVNC